MVRGGTGDEGWGDGGQRGGSQSQGTIHPKPVCKSDSRAGPWLGTAPVSPLPSPNTRPRPDERAEAMPDTQAQINSDAPALLPKRAPLNNQRSTGATPHPTAEGNP